MSYWPGVAVLEFFEQGDNVKPGINLQQRADLAVPDRAHWVFSGGQSRAGRWDGRLCATSIRWALRSLMPALATDAIWLSLLLRCCLHLCTWWSVMVLPDMPPTSEFVFEGLTVAPPPGPARRRPLTGQDS